MTVWTIVNRKQCVYNPHLILKLKLGVIFLQAKHASEGNVTWGVDGIKGTLIDMKELGVWEPLSVKLQTYKTAIEV